MSLAFVLFKYGSFCLSLLKNIVLCMVSDSTKQLCKRQETEV